MEDSSRSVGLFSGDGLSPQVESTLASISSLLGAITLALGVAGMVGWRLDISMLRELLPGAGAVRPTSAACIALLGGGLWFAVSRPALSRSLSLLAGLVAGLSFFDFLAGIEAFFREPLIHPRLLASTLPSISERVGAMNFVPALGYAVLAAALVTGRDSRVVVAAQTLTVTALFLALVPVVSFLYQVESLVSPLLPAAPSLFGAGAITLLSVGILCINPRRGVIGVLAADTAASQTGRRLLVPALLLPIVAGAVFLSARTLGSLDLDATIPVFVCALAATLGGSVLWAARAGARVEILHRRGEASLRETIDASPLMMWMADAPDQALYLNPALRQFLGAGPDDVSAGGWRTYTHSDDVERVEQEAGQAYQSVQTYSSEFRVRRADGQWRWVLATGMPRFAPDRQLAGFTGTWVDATERKDAESALQRFAAELEMRVAERTMALTASKEELARQTGLLESIVKSMGDALLAVSVDGAILLSNDVALRVFGASSADAHANARGNEYGFFRADGVTPFPSEQLPMIRALGGERVDNVVMVVKHREAPDGLWVRITGRPIRNPDGQIMGSIIVGRDVTEFEKALETTRRLAAVVESSGDAILSLTPEGRISTWNRGAEQMYGFTAEEVTGVPIGRLDTSFEKDGIDRMLATLAQGNSKVIRRDSVGRRHDGTRLDIATTTSPVHDQEGRVTALSVVHHDVTHLKAAERRIQALNDELAASVRDIQVLNNALEERVRDRTAALLAANHDLENYASSVAHDLRTPLRAIAGFAHVLEEDYGDLVDDEGRRVIGVVRKNAQDMGAFIDALLQFSAVDRQPPSKEQVDVAEVVRECVDSLGADCAERDVVFQVGDLPPCRADRASLKQVFLNLLANAVKFTRRTEKARVEIGSRIDESGATAYYVKDNGVGFDMSNTRRLFGIFQRLHAPADFEGTGLGLASVARIVAAHGGRVWAEAEPGKGATFHFILEQREGGT
ncbi:MAG: PAS domain S-box protein [Candidatus Binatia bacterium]